MATLGFDEEYTDSVEWKSGTATDNQFAVKLTMPERGRITRLGGYLRGKDASCSFRFVLWGSAGAVKAQTALLTATGAAASPTASVRMIDDVVAETIIDEGAEVYVGFSRAPAGAMQFGRMASGTHYENERDVIAGTFGDASAHAGGRIAMFAIYEPASEVYLRRSGAWVRADGVYVRRSGAWVEATGINVRRSGAWEEV